MLREMLRRLRRWEVDYDEPELAWGKIRDGREWMEDKYEKQVLWNRGTNWQKETTQKTVNGIIAELSGSERSDVFTVETAAVNI